MNTIKLDDSLIINIWEDCKQPIAIIQLIHGAMEHNMRYNKFGKFLNKNNIILVAHDLPGHGINLQNKIHHVNCKSQIINSCLQVNTFIDQKYNLPITILGHSMGSIITRNLILHNNIQYNKVVLSGTFNPSHFKVFGGIILQKIIIFFTKKEKANKLSNYLTFGIFKKMSSKKYNSNNWLTNDLIEYNKYKEDILCDNPFSNNFIYELLTLTKSAINKKNLKKLANQDLLIISGEQDPCSNFSKDIIKLKKILHSINKKNNDDNIIIFPNMKHEILNETNFLFVYNTIVDFIN